MSIRHFDVARTLWHDCQAVVDGDNELEGVPEPGNVIVGKYRVDRVLGTGGMGCVVAATHTALEQTVAIKFLLAKAARNPKNVVRFQREAQAAAKIRSDHVAKVSDIGTLDNGTPYMVMEFLQGEDMAQRLQRGPLGVHEAVSYLLQASEALAEAHQGGIVHRDLKPANLFLARLPDGAARVKVLDFGISKIVAGAGSGADLTKTSALMGSPLYMSPEQMMSAKAADHRADIWALGCILFEALSGQPPFIGETLPEICSHILTSPPSPLGQLAPATPPALIAIVSRCLAKDPQERFQNLGELATTLAPFGGEHAVTSAKTVRRVLGLPQLDDGAYQPAGGPVQAVPTAATPMAMAGAAPQPATDPSGAYHAAVQTGPGGSGQQVAVAAPLTAGGAQGGAPGYPPVAQAVTAGGALAAAQTGGAMVAQIGTCTAAPLAQTMGEPAPRKGRLPLVLALGGAVALAVVVGLAVGLRGNDSSTPASSDTAAATAGGSEVAASSPSATETLPTATASASAEAAATTSASSATAAVAHRSRPVAAHATATRPTRRHHPKRRHPTRVKRGDDRFNTLNP